MTSAQSPSHSEEKRYQISTIRDKTALPDPDMPQPRSHTYIFVCTNPVDGSGYIHQVTGDLVTGMRYESKPADDPEDKEIMFSKELLGTVKAAAYPKNVDDIRRAQPRPGKQKAFNVRTGRTEPIKANGSFYEVGEKKGPLFKCTEWTEQLAIPALMEAGVIIPASSHEVH